MEQKSEGRYFTESAGLLLGKIGLLFLFTGFIFAAWSGQTVVTIVLGMSVAASGLTLLWSRWCLKGVSCKREIREDRVFPGEEVELKMQLINRKILPMPWVQIDQDIPLELIPGAENLDTHPGFGLLSKSGSLLWYSKMKWSASLHCTRRGYYRLGGATVTSGDVFGFHTRSMISTAPDHIIVYPKLVPVENPGVPASYPLGSSNVDRMIFEDPLKVMGVRDYRAGDSLKNIHWKASARRGLLQVKVLEPSTTIEAAVFLSLDSYLQPGINDDEFEYGISTGASIARYLIKKGNPVGIFVNSKQADSLQAVRIFPGDTSHQMANILEALAKVTKNLTGPFDTFLNEEYRHLPWGTTIVVVVFRLTETLKELLSRIKDTGYRVMLYQTGKPEKESVPEI